MTTLRKTLAAAICASATSLGAAQAASLADPFTSFILFGDSLSDTGNLFAQSGDTFPPPPYFDGRFSNGPLWADQITTLFESQLKPTANFAFAGAKAVTDADPVPDFELQLGLYGTSPFTTVQGARPLVSVFFGGNDLRAIGGSTDPVTDGTAVAVALGQTVNGLIGAGITDIALWNAPDISKTPAVALFEPANVASTAAASAAFNAQISLEADRLRGLGANVYEIDFATQFDAVVTDPASFGFTDAVLPCLFPDATVAGLFGQPQLCSGADVAGRAFFDGFHPNAQGHELIAQTFQADMAHVPLPASGLLLLAGMGGLVVMRKRAA